MTAQQPNIEAIAAQLLVINSAVSAIAAASDRRLEILAYFDVLSEQLIAGLLARADSDEVVQYAQAHIQDFRNILTAPTAQPSSK